MRIGRRFVGWVALFLHVSSGPLAAISHRHEHGDAACCSAAADSVGGAADATASRLCRASGHACRFSRCRDAWRPADVAPGSAHEEHSGEPVARSGTARPPCLACQFLTKHVAVVPWTWFESSFLARWDEPAAHPIRIAAPRAAAFLARGPPA
jgi:hypothetical protein